MPPAILATGLRKVYDGRAVLDGVDLRVQRGEVVGILGPNGAGKTTLVETFQGLRRPDAGRVRVLGLDPVGDAERLRGRIGAQLQHAGLPERLRVREALELFADLAGAPGDARRLLTDWDLDPLRDRRFGALSGGQQQRVMLALALIGSPQVVFLDELTTGLDPDARRRTWRHVERLRDEGVTVVLVTHFLDEAERLCDRVVLLLDGRVTVDGTRADLARAAGLPSRVRIVEPRLEDAYLALVHDRRS